MKKIKRILCGVGIALLMTQQCFASNGILEGKDFQTDRTYWYSYEMNRTWLAGEMGSTTQKDVKVVVHYTTYATDEGERTGVTDKRSYTGRVKAEARTSTASPFSKAEYNYYFGDRKLNGYFIATPNGIIESN